MARHGQPAGGRCGLSFGIDSTLFIVFACSLVRPPLSTLSSSSSSVTNKVQKPATAFEGKGRRKKDTGDVNHNSVTHSSYSNNKKQLSADWSILKKLPMDGTPHEVLIWKLSMLAVKNWLKPAFLYFEFKSPTRGQLVTRYAERIGLAFKLCVRQWQLIDPSSPVEIARYVNGDGRGVWIYRRDEDSDFTDRPLAFVNRRVAEGSKAMTRNQGTMLGYPACCVQWYEDTIERRQGLKDMEFLRAKELFDVDSATRAMESPQFELGTDAQFQLDALENEDSRAIIYKSISTFPFIPHVACPSCVLSSRENSASSVMNSKLGGLARAVSPSFYS